MDNMTLEETVEYLLERVRSLERRVYELECGELGE